MLALLGLVRVAQLCEAAHARPGQAAFDSDVVVSVAGRDSDSIIDFNQTFASMVVNATTNTMVIVSGQPTNASSTCAIRQEHALHGCADSAFSLPRSAVHDGANCSLAMLLNSTTTLQIQINSRLPTAAALANYTLQIHAVQPSVLPNKQPRRAETHDIVIAIAMASIGLGALLAGAIHCCRNQTKASESAQHDRLLQGPATNRATASASWWSANREQVGFTSMLVLVGLGQAAGYSAETSFIGHLGKDAMAARSLVFSTMDYFWGISYLWYAVSTKIARSVGEGDAIAIAKLFKMSMILALACSVVTMVIVYAIGPWMIRTLYDPSEAVYQLAWPFLFIHAAGQPLDYANSMGKSTAQGLQYLRAFLLFNFIERAVFQPWSNYVCINVLKLGVNGSAYAHVARQVFMAFLWFGLLGRHFNNEKERLLGSVSIWKTVLHREDWKIFSVHSFYLLVQGYAEKIDSQLSAILVARLGTVDMAGNTLIWTMTNYPYVFSGAFGTAITTLGSKYLGERNSTRYQQMAIVLILVSLLLGIIVGGATLFFADDLLNLFTNEPDIKAIIIPVLPVFVPYMTLSMVRNVMGGMGWAMQEFGCMAVISCVGTLTYVPMVLYIKAQDEVSLVNLMRVGLYNQCITASLMAVLCLYVIPLRLRKLAAEELRSNVPSRH